MVLNVHRNHKAYWGRGEGGEGGDVYKRQVCVCVCTNSTIYVYTHSEVLCAPFIDLAKCSVRFTFSAFFLVILLLNFLCFCIVRPLLQVL